MYYHLSKTHPTEKCFIKVECDKPLASKKSNVASVEKNVSMSGQLCHLTEEINDSEELDEFDIEPVDSFSNDTKEDVLIYFALMSNHYLH